MIRAGPRTPSPSPHRRPHWPVSRARSSSPRPSGWPRTSAGPTCASSTPAGDRTAPPARSTAPATSPGAVYVDWRTDVIDTPEGGDALLLAAPDRVAATFSRAGVGDGTSVVIYDDTVSYFAVADLVVAPGLRLRVGADPRGWLAGVGRGRPPDRQRRGRAGAGRVHAARPGPGAPHHRRRPRPPGRTGRAARRRARAGRVPRLRGQRAPPRPHPGRGQRAGRDDAPAGHPAAARPGASCARSSSRRTSPAAGASSATTGRASRRRSSPTCSRCSATRTSRSTTAAGPSGATAWTSRSTASRPAAIACGSSPAYPARSAGPFRRVPRLPAALGGSRRPRRHSAGRSAGQVLPATTSCR